jgi:hypothetical protein
VKITNKAESKKLKAESEKQKAKAEKALSFGL